MKAFGLPIQATSLAAAQKVIDKNHQDFHYLELWVDYIDDLTVDTLTPLVNKYPGRIIIVFRRSQLDTPHMKADVRTRLLTALADLDVLVDLDVKSQQAELAHYNDRPRKGLLIVSFHDYQATPLELEAVVEAMVEFRPDIYKVATFCRDRNDALRLLELKQLLDTRGSKNIVLGMGQEGKVARIISNLWDNEIVFAPLSISEASAPGQLTKQQMETIGDIVNEVIT